jgi:hypothetical protein
MENAVSLRVPLEVKLMSGKTWNTLSNLSFVQSSENDDKITRAIFDESNRDDYVSIT